MERRREQDVVFRKRESARVFLSEFVFSFFPIISLLYFCKSTDESVAQH